MGTMIRIKWLMWLGMPTELNPCYPAGAVLALPDDAPAGSSFRQGVVSRGGKISHYLSAPIGQAHIGQMDMIEVEKLSWHDANTLERTGPVRLAALIV